MQYFANPMGLGIPDLPQRLQDLLSPCPITGCWFFDGVWESRNGYGRLSWEGKTTQIHIVTFKMLRYHYDPKLVLDHLCRVPPCANPWHLEPITTQENTLRGNGPQFWYRSAS